MNPTYFFPRPLWGRGAGGEGLAEPSEVNHPNLNNTHRRRASIIAHSQGHSDGIRASREVHPLTLGLELEAAVALRRDRDSQFHQPVINPIGKPLTESGSDR